MYARSQHHKEIFKTDMCVYTHIKCSHISIDIPASESAGLYARTKSDVGPEFTWGRHSGRGSAFCVGDAEDGSRGIPSSEEVM